MSLGLPGHLAPHSESRAFARASHVIALVCLIAAELLLLGLQQARPGTILWPSMIALVPMVAALWFVERHNTWFFSVAYLIVGAASMYWFVLAGTSQFPGEATTDSYALTLPKIALIMVGGSGLGAWRVIGWSTVGLLAGEGATLLAAAQTGAQAVPDITALAVYAIAAVLLALIGINRARVQRAKPSLQRAARDEHLSDIRHRIEVRAAAMLHDTILNHLAAVAASPDGELRSDLRSRIGRDLEVLVGEEWLVDGDGVEDAAARAEWIASRLFRALDEARDLGLDVALTGDHTAIARLDPARQNAVALAVKQCLVNVIKHAGTDRAEVVVYGADREVSVMIIDGGKGFSERETSVDRLGLRQSVRKRIETVGGTVQVWSTPGTGTSILIRLPATVAATEPGTVS
jgi:signal transduction histidine kinase